MRVAVLGLLELEYVESGNVSDTDKIVMLSSYVPTRKLVLTPLFERPVKVFALLHAFLGDDNGRAIFHYLPRSGAQETVTKTIYDVPQVFLNNLRYLFCNSIYLEF